MATIKWLPDGPSLPDTVETFEDVHLVEWMLGKWDKHTVPDKLRIFEGCISAETDITELLCLGEYDIDDSLTYEVTVMPQGTVVAAVAVGLFIAVAATEFFAPRIEPPLITPVTQNNNQASSNTQGLGSRVNKPRLDARLPDIYGTESKCIPDLWSNYRLFEDNVELDVSYLCVSRGQCDTTNHTDGGVAIADIRKASLEVYQPFTSPRSGDAPSLRIGEPITHGLYIVEESEQVTGQSILPPNVGASDITYSISRNGLDGRVDVLGGPSLLNAITVGDVVEFSGFFVFKRRPVTAVRYERFSIEGNYTITAVDTTGVNVVLTQAVADTWDLHEAPTNEIPSIAYQGQENSAFWVLEPLSGYDLVNLSPQIIPTEEGATTGPFDVNGAQQVLINLVADNGLYKKDNDGPSYFDVTFQVTIIDKDTSARSVTDVIISSNGEERAGQTALIPVPYSNATVQCVRITDRDYTFEGTVVDDIRWRDLYFLSDPQTTDFGDVTTIFSVTRGTQSAIKLKELKLACRATRYAKEVLTPSQVAVNRSPSNRFADVVYEIHNDPRFGRLGPADINLASLWQAQRDISDYFLDNDYYRVGYTFDTLTTRYEEALALICNAVSVDYMTIGNEIHFRFERSQANSAMQFGHRSKDLNSDEIRTRNFRNENGYDSVALTFKDETTQDYRTLFLPETGDRFKTKEVDLLGAINEKVATVRLHREMNKLKYSKVQHTFTALEIARLASRGLRVDVVDNTDFKGNGGYVDRQQGLQLVLSEPVVINGPTSIGLTKLDGSVDLIPVTAVAGDEFSVTLSRAPEEAVYTGYEREKTEYTVYADSERDTAAMLIRTITSNGIDDIEIECVNYDDRYYSEDLLV